MKEIIKNNIGLVLFLLIFIAIGLIIRQKTKK